MILYFCGFHFISLIAFFRVIKQCTASHFIRVENSKSRGFINELTDIDSTKKGSSMFSTFFISKDSDFRLVAFLDRDLFLIVSLFGLVDGIKSHKSWKLGWVWNHCRQCFWEQIKWLLCLKKINFDKFHNGVYVHFASLKDNLWYFHIIRTMRPLSNISFQQKNLCALSPHPILRFLSSIDAYKNNTLASQFM